MKRSDTPSGSQALTAALIAWYRSVGYKYLEDRNYKLSASGLLLEALAKACRRAYGRPDGKVKA